MKKFDKKEYLKCLRFAKNFKMKNGKYRMFFGKPGFIETKTFSSAEKAALHMYNHGEGTDFKEVIL